MSDATVNATAAAAAEASDSVAAGAPLISLDHVTVEFGRGKNRFRAVDDVSLTINKGSIYGIIGFSGAGKSTLVRTMNVLQRPTSGTVTFNGTTISTLGEGRLLPLRRKIAMIFQHFNLMPSRTVLDNVTLPLIHEKVSRKDARAKAMHLLELVGIADKAKAYPRQLSGGQQQRVAIARALITKPSLVFADEPTGNLDSVSSAEVLSFLKRSVKELGQTVIMVTHDAVAASYADRAIVFADGQIVADEQRPTAESMNQLLMNERERATQLVGGPSAGTTVPRPPVAALKGHTEKASFVPGAPSVPGAPQHAAVAQHRR
mgnify:FL=1